LRLLWEAAEQLWYNSGFGYLLAELIFLRIGELRKQATVCRISAP
jgi:hypothetical protein